MADFKDINDRIDEEITENGQGDITGLVLNSLLKAILAAVGTHLDGKVNTEPGKGLSTNDFTTALENKLTGLINIRTTDYDAANDRITIGGKTYQLTEYVPIPDYYVGFAGGTSDDFRNMGKEDLLAAVVNSGGSLVGNNPTYSGTWNNYTIFVMLKSGVSVACTYVNQGTPQSLELNMTPPHDTVTIDGTTYTVVARRMANANIGQDTYTLNFTKN